MRAILPGVVTALFLGCGSDGGSFTGSCDTMSGGTHSCTDFALSGVDVTQLQHDCAQKGGTIGSACSHTGAIGGCRVSFSGYGGSGTTTTWDYAGTASALMMECTINLASLRGTWLTP